MMASQEDRDWEQHSEPPEDELDNLLDFAIASESKNLREFCMQGILDEQFLGKNLQTMKKQDDEKDDTATEFLRSYQASPPWLAPIFRLPHSALHFILRWVFIPQPYHPLVLPREPRYSNQTYKFVKAVRPVLRTCKIIHVIGRAILYRENTFTTATPSTSYDLDRTLSRMCRWQQKMITSLILKIDWADELWAKFALIVVALQELENLHNLEIRFVSTPPNTKELRPTAEANYKMHEIRKEAAKRQKRQGTRAELMLNAEKKMLKEFVTSARSLRTFRLVGFADEDFARQLELLADAKIRAGNRFTGA